MFRKIKILSIDGGGIKGIIPAMVLEEVENRTGKKINDLFDFIAGTSTGGIITLALTKANKHGKPEYSAKDLVRIYEEDGKVIFATNIRELNESIISLTDKYNSIEYLDNISKVIKFIPGMDKIRKYVNDARDSISGVLESTTKIEDRINIVLGPKLSVENLKKVLEKYMGKAKLKESLNNVLITAYNLKSTEYTIIVNNKKKNRNNMWGDVYIKDLAVATSAVPTIFEPAQIMDRLNTTNPLVDGGIFAPNPSLCAYVEAQKIFNKVFNKFMLVSLGTGTYRKSIDYVKAKDWGIIDWANKLINIVLNGMTNMVHQYLSGLIPEDMYYRINPEFINEPDFNSDPTDASRKNIEKLKNTAEKLIKEKDKEIDDICKLLT
jgi:uncharacterized protein